MASPTAELDLKIQAASNWAMALGAIFLVSSLLQLIGYFPRDLAVLNLVVSVAAIVLGAVTARRPSPIPLLILCVLFVAIVVDTLVTTQYVLNQFGVIFVAIMLVRYVILIAALRAMGQALVGLLNQRKVAASAERIVSAGKARTSAKDAKDTDANLARADGRLEPAANPTVALLKVMAALLVLGAMIMALALPLDDGGAIFATVMLLVAGGAFYASNIEKVYLPNLVADLKRAVSERDDSKIAALAAKFVPLKSRASRALAVAMLEQPTNEAFVSQAALIVRQTGVLEEDANAALRLTFVEDQSCETNEEVARTLGILGMHLEIPTLLQGHRDVIQAAARARLFDDDEYWVAAFGDQFLITTKALYKLGGLPEIVLLRDIESARDNLASGKNIMYIQKRDGETIEYKVNWSTGAAGDVVKSLLPALQDDFMRTLQEPIRLVISGDVNSQRT